MVAGKFPTGTSVLPYTDTKPVGAAGFFLGINATFRFIQKKFGREGLIQYWKALGDKYFAPVSSRWTLGGLPAVADYWRAFFEAEPDARVLVDELPDRVIVCVTQCPAIHHLRENGREIMGEFCEHCYWVSDAMAAPAGLEVRVSGGNGSCRQEFLRRGTSTEQDMGCIARCS